MTFISLTWKNRVKKVRWICACRIHKKCAEVICKLRVQNFPYFGAEFSQPYSLN